jgi:hypothetical protein
MVAVRDAAAASLRAPFDDPSRALREPRPDRHEGDQVECRREEPHRRLERAVRGGLTLLSPASRATLEFRDIGNSPGW